MKDLIDYFAHMERIILGTAFIDNENRSSGNYPTGGSSFESEKCPKCSILFVKSRYEEKEKQCPYCHHDWKNK